MKSFTSILWFFCLAAPTTIAQDVSVKVFRVPDGGVQPQVVVDSDGVVYLIYLTSSDPGHSDIFYCRSSDFGGHWTKPVRVNSEAGSAIAIGTVRGAHLAVSKGTVHVAWMGSGNSHPKAPFDAAPMLYARMSPGAGNFEAQRNLIHEHVGLDGGGSIAADDSGDVFVAWHAPQSKDGNEQDRRVWVARSSDNGKTFAAEVPISDAATGVCGCCGMRVFCWRGNLLALYRGAAQQVERGMYLIDTSSDLSHPLSRQIAPMNSGVCIMSTTSIAGDSQGLLAAWETKGQVFWSRVNPSRRAIADAISPPGQGENRKHPAVAGDSVGRVILAWTERTGWNRGGSILWQVFGSDGKAISGASGRADDLPVWDCPAVFTAPGGTFVVIY